MNRDTGYRSMDGVYRSDGGGFGIHLYDTHDFQWLLPRKATVFPTLSVVCALRILWRRRPVYSNTPFYRILPASGFSYFFRVIPLYAHRGVTTRVEIGIDHISGDLLQDYRAFLERAGEFISL